MLKFEVSRMGYGFGDNWFGFKEEVGIYVNFFCE